ncbi:unnamed protein product, partial [Didymodactylos carnosus]
MDSSTYSTSQSNSKPPDPKPQSSFNTTVSTKPGTIQSPISSHVDSVENILQKSFIEEIIKNPKTFTGKENVSSWLEEIDQQFTTSKWPEDSRLQYIPQFPRNEARQWYKENKTKITTWSQFKTDIKTAYTSTYEVTLAFQRLKNYQQTNNQTVKQYYAEILKLCEEADIQVSEQMKLQYLLDNLKPSIKIKVIEKSPKTTAQFLEYAKTVEDLQTLISSDPNLSHFA